MEKIDYEKDIDIDETALDVEWLNQPYIMLKYNEAESEARRKYDLEKENLSVVKAEAEKKIRSDPESYIDTKITEGAITMAVTTLKEVKNQQISVIEAKYEWDMIKGAVTAVDQRKTALENLVKLYGLGYFAGPKTPRDLPAHAKEKTRSLEIESKRKRSNQNVKINRKHKK